MGILKPILLASWSLVHKFTLILIHAIHVGKLRFETQLEFEFDLFSFLGTYEFARMISNSTHLGQFIGFEIGSQVKSYTSGKVRFLLNYNGLTCQHLLDIYWNCAYEFARMISNSNHLGQFIGFQIWS